MTDRILNHPQAKPWQPLLVFVLFAVALGVAGAFVFQRYEARIKRDKQDELGGIAKLKIAQIANWIDERKDDARALRDDPLFVAEADRWLRQGAPSGATRTKLERRLLSLQSSYSLSGTVCITLFDARGAMRLSTSANDRPQREHVSEQVLESVRTGETLLTDIHRSGGSDGNALEFDLITPLLAKRGNRMRQIGVVGIHMDPRRFLFPLVQNWPTSSASAENLLVRRDGDAVLFLNELRHRSDTALKMRLPLDPHLLATMAVMGKEGYVEGVDYRGIAVVGVLNKIPGTPWSMVSKIDLAEVNAPIHNLGNWVMLLMLCLTGLGGGVIGMWWRKQRQQFRALDNQLALELERQSLSRHLSYLTRYANDIILFMDGNGSIVDFNDRALQAYGYTAAELTHMEYSRLRADHNQPLISGLSGDQDQASTTRLECMHVRKNGEVFPVEYSVCNIDIGGERYAQKIIRDITERKQAEEKLLRLNRSLKLLVDCNSALVLIDDEKRLLAEINKLIVETGGYRMAWVGFAVNDPRRSVVPAAAYGHDDGYLETVTISWEDNEYGRGPTGTAIRSGRTQVNQDVRANPAMSPWRNTALAHNYLSSIALPLKHEGNCFGALTIYADRPQAFSTEEIALLEELAGNLAYGVMALRTATERKHAETRLDYERTRLRTLVQTIPDLVWLKDAEGVYLECNRRFELFVGAQEADIVGKTDYDFVDRELADFFRQHDRMAMAANKASVNEEWLTFASDGYRGLFETIKTPMRDSHGKLIGVLGVARDITERIASEQSIRELNADLDATLKAIPDLLFELDQDGRYINIWARTPEMLVAQEEQLLGHTVSEMLPPETAATVMAALQDAEQNGYSHGQVIRLELAQGECWFELSTSVKSVAVGHGKRYIMLSRDITERKLTARTLASSYAQLQKLSLHMESVRAEERAKIALNLHDEMGATLAALKMRIAWLASRLPATAPLLRSEAEQITALVSDGIHTMHQIVFELRPYSMDDGKLADAIGDYVKKFQLHTRIECVLDLNEASFDLDAERSLAVFRILQESLNNVVSHAKANRVSIHFSERDDSLLMAIKDNGVGFDAAPHKERSFGMLGIRERALMVGGKARIVSAPGKGTRVSVSIPYPSGHLVGGKSQHA